MVEVSYTKSALADLKNIFNYFSKDSKLHAKLFTTALKIKIDSLNKYPEKGRPLFPLQHSSLRQIPHKSYKIIYAFEGDRVSILVITHQSRLNSNIDALKQYYI